VIGMVTHHNQQQLIAQQAKHTSCVAVTPLLALYQQAAQHPLHCQQARLSPIMHNLCSINCIYS
jgi:hypothetical protein